MTEYIEWLRLFLINHRSLEYVIIFGGAVVGGEITLFILGFLSAQNVLSIFPVFVLSFFCYFLPNILWFLLGRTVIVEKIVKHRYTNTTTLIITEAISRVSKGSHFFALIFIKFLVGTPIMLIIYANKTKLKFGEFLVYETPAILLSLFIIISIGFLSGLGFIYLANIFNNIYVAIGFILLIVLVIVGIQSWLKTKFTNIKNQDIVI